MLSGLRARALLLVLLAAAPVFVLLLYQDHQASEAAKRQALVHADELRRFIGTSFEDQIENAREILEILARKDVGQCPTLARDFQSLGKYYANIGATTPAGDVRCSAEPRRAPVNISDRAWFKTVVATRSFVIGEAVTGRISNRPVLVMALPAYNNAGKLRAVYFASLDLAWFSEYAARAKLLPRSVIAIIDGEAKILSHYPHPEKWTNKLHDENFMLRLRAEPSTMFERTGLDGVQRLYASAPLIQAGQKTPLYLVVGMPLDDALAGMRQA